MTPTLESLEALAARLPSLESPEASDKHWLGSESVQAYLNHYNINFLQEGLCQHHSFGRFRASGFDVAAHIWRPAAPAGTVFFIHGFTDNVGLMQHALRFLLQQKFAVVAFDLPGHGLSSGDQASIDSFDQYRDVFMVCMRKVVGLPHPWHAVGQSTGGAVLLNFLGSLPQQQSIEKVMLLAPLIRPQGWALARWVFPIYKMLVRQLPRKFNQSSHDADFLRFVENEDPLQTRITPMRWAVAMEEWIDNFWVFDVQKRPLTIIQGDSDQTVDFEYNLEAIREKFPHTRVVNIVGGRHQLVNESEQYREKVMSALKDWLWASSA
ncbi:alpha/beta hydrolase [Pseudomaricurvus alkylphenolicus]|jgi:alpha-beta hydrolase superfamily lysophospholipase|uniref:alpha/beta hydrolase n=1 Tax=Pseudomaricurvus alkylphenolicus TaxID=1306991 RepID=UPI001421D2F5|nr:alpha/beta hydrolase [Pseudomaricurvus alkylphenolicus]NIB39377.1 alpha/beta hydrolase [Pseudomaricurvus alkylphenolicus]